MHAPGTKNIALFCSGSGSNAEQIMRYFHGHTSIRVAALLANRADAYALERAKNFSVPTLVFDRETFRNTTTVQDFLNEKHIDYIILAGFLWLVPDYLVAAYPDRIINIHPALLPKHGGKGMFGANVHRAVREANDKESGITIHLVNEIYDSGRILFQATCPIGPDDTAEEIASKVLQLEHRHFAPVIERYIEGNQAKASRP
jgi:phosphoribosylglycinamide formyltransferase 1